MLDSILRHHHPSSLTINDDCRLCMGKLCCIVYSIMDSKSHKTVKGEYIRCEKLDSDGNCTIHSRRKNYPGYRESCIEYTCGNV